MNIKRCIEDIVYTLFSSFSCVLNTMQIDLLYDGDANIQQFGWHSNKFVDLSSF